jgi:hypothetical protein
MVLEGSTFLVTRGEGGGEKGIEEVKRPEIAVSISENVGLNLSGVEIFFRGGKMVGGDNYFF